MYTTASRKFREKLSYLQMLKLIIYIYQMMDVFTFDNRLDWLYLKKEYLNVQKESMKNLKQSLKQMKMEDSSEQNKGTCIGNLFLNHFRTTQIKCINIKKHLLIEQ